jgi:hypothetical protein
MAYSRAALPFTLQRTTTDIKSTSISRGINAVLPFVPVPAMTPEEAFICLLDGLSEKHVGAAMAAN